MSVPIGKGGQSFNDISKKIDTYDISILPFEDCCTVFVPKHPVINPNLELCIEMENRFDYCNITPHNATKLIHKTIDYLSNFFNPMF